jgi:hypothetical protein
MVPPRKRASLRPRFGRAFFDGRATAGDANGVKKPRNMCGALSLSQSGRGNDYSPGRFARCSENIFEGILQKS